MTIKLHNTLTRKIEDFTPIVPGQVGIYTCGPTVYHYAHIGNLRAYIHADQLRRMFLANGYKVKHIMNITDVGHLTDDGDHGEDKMEKGAERTGKTVWEVARYYEEAFLADTALMNILPMDATPRATECVPEQIDLVKQLEAKGYTYEIPGDGIYYDTSKFADYGKLTGGSLEGNRGGERVSDDGKKQPADFALWKFSRPNENRAMEWDSPWGRGFPGWHIECNAMASVELGAHFDIHTGGIDHIPVHHTNEIAQAEPLLTDGKPWVNYWIHMEFLTDHTGKMSKSSGEFLKLSVLIDRGYDPMHYRYMITLGHYQSQMVLSWEAMDAAKNGYERIVRKVAGLLHNLGGAIFDKNRRRDLSNHAPPSISDWKQKLLSPLSNNLRTAESLIVFRDMLDDETLSDSEKLELVAYADELLGLNFIESAKKLSAAAATEVPDEIKKMADERMAAKKNRDFALADSLREKIAAAGWTVTDTAAGYTLLK